jgi:hypothetical protein
MGGAIDASDHGTGPSGAPTPPTGTPPATPVAGESPGVGEAYDSVPVTPGTSSMKPGKASLKLVGTPDLSNMRRVMRSEKCMTKGFEHLFKHMNEADVHEVTRIQAMQHMLKCGQFYKGLYGACGMQIPGETTAPEPKI